MKEFVTAYYYDQMMNGAANDVVENIELRGDSVLLLPS